MLSSINKALFIGAHPDDIEFYCGGLIYMMRERGVEVIFAIATKGGKGRTGAARERLESLRSRHQLDAAEILGEARVILFDYPDKSLVDYIEPFANDLKALISQEKPDIVFSWDPDHIYNPHPDHQAAADSARIAIKATGSRACHYGTRMPNLWVGFDDDIYKIKLKSIMAHRTEMPWYFAPLPKRLLYKRLTLEGPKAEAKYAEAYRQI